ncbi:MAG: hypothetical protein IJT23_04465 [Clostridia bacterium]|nr:hypothetical protein [Clostridia bacterium]
MNYIRAEMEVIDFQDNIIYTSGFVLGIGDPTAGATEYDAQQWSGADANIDTSTGTGNE